jgi:uncharacterized membrane protein YraQ (UPF0718 family)
MENPLRIFRDRLGTLAENTLQALPVWVVGLLAATALTAWLGSAFQILPVSLVGLIDLLSSFTTVFLGIFIEAVPYLLLGTLASGLLEVFFSQEDIASFIPRQIAAGTLVGGLLGLFFPVCECGVVPLTRRFYHKGVPIPVGITFLLAAPVINPIVIASTWVAFGNSPIFWGRLVLTFVIAVLTGMIFSLLPQADALIEDQNNPATLSTAADLAAVSNLPDMNRKPSFAARLRSMLVISANEFFEMGRYLVIGSILAALLQTFVPQAAFLSLSRGPVVSVIVMILLAVLLSVCSTVDAFIALAFVNVFSPGSILAFLVFGPMVDIKSTLMFLRVFRKKNVVLLVTLPLILTIIAAVAMNYFTGW